MKHHIWAEEFRPKTVEDCLLPGPLKATLQGYIKQEKFPNLILAGQTGRGKTTVARAMCEEIGSPFLFYNGSLNVNLDTLRTEIASFASSRSLNGARKVVIIDEADFLNHHVQPAFRAFIEEFAPNCSFIFTCNHPEKIIEAIHSRCTLVKFEFPNNAKPELIRGIYQITMNILEKKGVEYSKEALQEVIKRNFPDFRKILNELQGYSSTGKIDTGILALPDNLDIKKLWEFIKSCAFTDARKWVAETFMRDQEVFDALYKSMDKYTEASGMAMAIPILAKYQYQAAFVANREINLAACIADMMVTLKGNLK